MFIYDFPNYCNECCNLSIFLNQKLWKWQLSCLSRYKGLSQMLTEYSPVKPTIIFFLKPFIHRSQMCGYYSREGLIWVNTLIRNDAKTNKHRKQIEIFNWNSTSVPNLRFKQVKLALVTAVQRAESCCCKSRLFQIGVDDIREHSTIIECLCLSGTSELFSNW